MSQSFPTIASDGSSPILTDLPSIIDRDEALRSMFSGASAPASPVQWQIYKNTTDGIVYVCVSVGPAVWTPFLPFLLSSGGALTGKLQLAEGASVASAATVNFDAATGNFVHVTGTTGITTMTLAQGTWMLVCFDGILTITNSGSLICHGAANITTAAGDVALLIGDGGGITRMAGYFRANGYPVQAMLAALAAMDSSAGLVEQTGANAVTKRAIGVGASTSIPTRADGDGRWQTLAALLSAIVASTGAGLIEQLSGTTVTKRTIGVAASADIPDRAAADTRWLTIATAAATYMTIANAINKDGSVDFTAMPGLSGEGNLMRAASGGAANSGKVSWGTGAPGSLAEGEVYLRHA